MTRIKRPEKDLNQTNEQSIRPCILEPSEPQIGRPSIRSPDSALDIATWSPPQLEIRANLSLALKYNRKMERDIAESPERWDHFQPLVRRLLTKSSFSQLEMLNAKSKFSSKQRKATAIWSFINPAGSSRGPPSDLACFGPNIPCWSSLDGSEVLWFPSWWFLSWFARTRRGFRRQNSKRQKLSDRNGAQQQKVPFFKRFGTEKSIKTTVLWVRQTPNPSAEDKRAIWMGKGNPKEKYRGNSVIAGGTVLSFSIDRFDRETRNGRWESSGSASTRALNCEWIDCFSSKRADGLSPKARQSDWRAVRIVNKHRLGLPWLRSEIGFFFGSSDLPRLKSSAAFSMILRPAAHTKPNCLQLFEALMTVRCIHSRWDSGWLFLWFFDQKNTENLSLSNFLTASGASV